MRLLSRSVLREVWPPFALGFLAYTFILLVRTIYFLADFFVRRSATFGEVVWLVVLSLPWIVVLTLPMAFLVGILVGIGRLSGDSEVVAMRACGVGPWAIYRPVLIAAAVLSGIVFFLYNQVLPPANENLSRSMSRVAATSIVSVVQPRVFREARPGLTLYFDRTASDGRSLAGVFVKLGEDLEPGRVIVARRGALTLEGDRLWLDLYSSTLHDYDPKDPARYRTNRNQWQRILVAGDLWNSPAARVSYEKSLRGQSISELARSARKARAESPENFRLAWVEIHKKIAIPFACFAFAVVGIPLAERSRRGGRGSGFAISLALIVLYYVLLSSGETWAEEGKLSPGPAIWLPNAVLLLLGGIAIGRARRERAKWRWPFRRETAAGPERRLSRISRARFAGLLRFPALLDRYVLARFFSVLLLVALSVLLLAVIVDYADHVDKIARNHASGRVVLGYYRYFLLSIGVQIAPLAMLLATLICLGILSKNNEDTAFKASGVSLHRLGASVLVAAVLGAGLIFSLGEYVLPFAEQRQMRYRNIIYGRDPEAGVGTAVERSWYHASDGRIWHRAQTDPSGALVSPTAFQFDSNFDLVRRDSAREATWNGGGWVFRQGWTRTFGGPIETSYRTYLDQTLPGDPPPAFAREKRTPEQMRFRELQRYVRRLKASGYPTGELDTALASKLAAPLLLPLMTLLGIPFAFRIGRRGALAGIGVGLALGIAFLIATAFFTKLGGVGALPPLLAAWSPNVLAATAVAYLLLKLRT